MKRHLIPPFRSGPWTAATAPADATHVDGVPIAERLTTRADAPGAVVKLANGRFAIIGDTSFAVGRPLLLLQMFVARRAAAAADAAERAWWRQVEAVL